MDSVILIGPNERPKDGSQGRMTSQASVSSVGRVQTDGHLTDTSGNKVEISEGSLNVAVKESYEAEGLLTDILRELKIMNMHLALLSDNQIDREDVE